MPLPGAISTGTVVGTFLSADGDPLTGKVTLTPEIYLRGAGVTVVPEPEVLTLTAGAVSKVVAATDDTDLQPAGWRYRVREDIATQRPRTYFIQVPAGATVDLSSVAHAEVPSTLITPVRTVEGIGPDANGNIDLPAGGGGVSDHGDLTGLGDDDHLQYHTDTRGDARYFTQSQVTAALVGKENAGVAATLDAAHVAAGDPHPQYLTAAEGNAAYAAAGHTHPQSDITNLVTDLAAKVPTSRTVTAGTGLSGGGDLSANRTLAVSYGTAAGTAAEGNDTRLGDLRPIYPLAGYDLAAASGDPQTFSKVLAAFGSGYQFFTRIWVPAGVAFSQLVLAVKTSATYSADGRTNQLAVYTDAGVLIDSTPDDSAMWATSDTWYVGTLSLGTVAAQSAGRFIYGSFTIGGFANVSPLFSVAADIDVLNKIPGSSRRRTAYLTSQTGPIGTFNPNTVGNATNYVPLIGLRT